MASDESIQGFVLKGVTPLNRKGLGRGAYGKAYEVKYCETGKDKFTQSDVAPLKYFCLARKLTRNVSRLSLA